MNLTSQILNIRPSVLMVGNFLSAKLGTRSVSEDLKPRLEEAGMEVVASSRYVFQIRRLWDMLTTAFRLRREYQVATVEVYSGKAFVWAEVVCSLLRRCNKPYILMLHGGNLPAFAERWPRRVSHLLNSAQAVTTPSHFLQKSLSPCCSDIIYLPNALDITAYTFQHRAKARPHASWLRALHNIYNPVMAVETVALLKGEFPDFTLDVMGPDKTDGTLQQIFQLMVKQEIKNNVHIVGPIPKCEVPLKLNESDIFLNTTRYESFGVSVLEAAASGHCIVTTSVGELPYLWTDEHDVLMVPLDDSRAMATAVRRILTEPGLAEHLSQNARNRAEQFDWSVVLPQWEELLMTVANGGSA